MAPAASDKHETEEGQQQRQLQQQQDKQQQQQQQGKHHAAKGAGQTVESWSSTDQRIVVGTPAEGFVFQLGLHAKVEATPREVYEVLTTPAAKSIFRSVKAVKHRELLEDDGKGRQRWYVIQEAYSRFLWLSFNFDTFCETQEDANEMTINFKDVKDNGFMRKFEGVWRVRPFTQASLDDAFQQQHHTDTTNSEEAPATTTLVTLEQSLAPRRCPPGPLRPLVRSLCARALTNMMHDVRAELKRRKDGATAAAAAAAGEAPAGAEEAEKPGAEGGTATAGRKQAGRAPGGHRPGRVVLPVASFGLRHVLHATPSRSGYSL